MTANADTIGYFGPDSLSWRLYREPWVLLGGFRALLLQIAHPSVAEGVARYSNFQQDALGRGYRTFVAMATIYFGTRNEADRVGERLTRVHRGMPVAAAGPGQLPAGALTTAANADLQLWVWATLVETTFHVFTPLEKALDLPANWQATFYQESRTAARVLRIPETVIPIDLEAFTQYFQQILHDPHLLASTSEGSQLAKAILEHKLVWRPLGRLLALGWLPDDLCQRLGIQVGPRSRPRFTRLLKTLAWCYRLSPRGLRYNPAWHQALYRIRRAEERSPGWLGRWYWWLVRRGVPVPLGIGN